MKKRSKILIALVVIASMFTITVQAKDFAFVLTTKGVAKQVSTNQRNRTDATWLLTNSNTPSSTFTVGKHVLIFRVRNESRQAMSDGITVKTFITNVAYPYTNTPSMNQPLLLFTQLDSTSSESTVTCYGKWFT